jgi:hypothetical protein
MKNADHVCTREGEEKKKNIRIEGTVTVKLRPYCPKSEERRKEKVIWRERAQNLISTLYLYSFVVPH